MCVSRIFLQALFIFITKSVFIFAYLCKVTLFKSTFLFKWLKIVFFNIICEILILFNIICDIMYIMLKINLEEN